MTLGPAISKVLNTIEEQEIPVNRWISCFLGIIFIRFILEQLSNPTSYSGIIASDTYTLVHYGLFFFALLLGISLIIGYFVKNYSNVLKILLFALPVIWLAPVLDLITTLGQGRVVAYLADSHLALFWDFLTFFGPLKEYGITLGIRIELLVILFFIGFYVWKTTKNYASSALAVLVSYIFIFLALSTPGVFYTILGKGGEGLNAVQFLGNKISYSNLVHNTFQEPLPREAYVRFFELTFNKLMSQIFFAISVILALIYFLKANLLKFKAVLSNCRPERISMYLCLLFGGAFFAYFYKFGSMSGFIDGLTLFCLGISWFGAWMYSVHINDIEDKDIDSVSNNDRPLITNLLSQEEMRQTSYIWLAASLAGAWCAGFYPFFMNMVFISAYYIYSARPIRLKRVPILSSFLISIACLATVMAGFFTVSFDKKISAFPLEVSLAIIVFFILVSNIRDLKDIAGDKQAGINTLPVIFGEKSFKIIGFLTVFAILILPLLISVYKLYFIAMPVAVVSYLLITRKPYKEKPLFILFFISLGIVILFTIL